MAKRNPWNTNKACNVSIHVFCLDKSRDLSPNFKTLFALFYLFNVSFLSLAKHSSTSLRHPRIIRNLLYIRDQYDYCGGLIFLRPFSRCCNSTQSFLCVTLKFKCLVQRSSCWVIYSFGSSTWGYRHFLFKSGVGVSQRVSQGELAITNMSHTNAPTIHKDRRVTRKY